MRDFFRSPLFRCLVCLILVCCILVNLSPVRAEALPISTWVWLEASMVFASLFAGLGVSPVDELAHGFADACNNCWDFISLNYDFVTDEEKIAVWATGTDEMPFMIDQELVEVIRDWLFSSEFIEENIVSVADGKWLYGSYEYYPIHPSVDLTSYPYIYFDGSNMFFSPTPFTAFSSSGDFVMLTVGTGNYMVCQKSSSSALGWLAPVTKTSTYGYCYAFYDPTSYVNAFSNHDIYGTTDYNNNAIVLNGSNIVKESGSVCSSSNDSIVLNYVAPSSEDFPTGYSTWAAGAISVPGIRSKEEEKEVVVPLSIPGTAADVYSFAQTDVWTGANTAADVIAQAVPITGTDTGDSSVPSVPEVPAEVAPYTFSLNDIFPFCIPFDLYDFLTCLDATPVAPVINWELHLPGGSTYPLTVDLSAFDSVAQLLRRLELLVFSIALAIKTRDLIKG